MRRWLALGVVGLGVAWGPYVYSELARQPARPATPKQPETSLFEESDPAPPMAAAASSRVKFESQTVAATAEPPAPRPVAPAPVAAVEAPAVNPADPSEPATGGEDLADPSGLPVEFAPAFRNAFETQPRDAFWAAEEEPRLVGLIHAVGVPEGVISEVACRKTVCRAAFGSLDLDKEIELKLYSRLRETYGHTLALEVREIEGGAHAALYVLRKGYKLDSPASAAPPAPPTPPTPMDGR
jgi:hypothetical protein